MQTGRSLFYVNTLSQNITVQIYAGHMIEIAGPALIAEYQKASYDLPDYLP